MRGGVDRDITNISPAQVCEDGAKCSEADVSSFLCLLTGCALVAPPLPPPTKSRRDFGGIHHTVKRGENLWRIGRAYGVEVEQIAVLKRHRQSDRLEAGVRLSSRAPEAHASYEKTSVPGRPNAARAGRLRRPGKRRFVEGLPLSQPENPPRSRQAQLEGAAQT